MRMARILVERDRQETNAASPVLRHKNPRVGQKRHHSGNTSQSASPTSVTTFAPTVTGPVAPRLEELKRDQAYTMEAMPMPEQDTVQTLSTMRILCADSTHGIGLWGERERRWCKPSGWASIVEELNHAYTDCGAHDKNIVTGEYNAVFIDCVQKYCSDLPSFETADGTPVPLSELVFRITRPDVEHDADSNESTVRHRYKTLQEQSDEMYYSLHGAANGYAIPCLAAMTFAGPKVRRKGKTMQLYGSLYVLKKAPVNLNNVLEDHSKHLVKTKGYSVGSEQHDTALVKGARRVALRVLPVLVKSAMLGGIYFDCKPSNTLFVEGANVYISDFDAAMYTIMRSEDTSWEAHLFMSLLLLLTHIRCYQPTGVAEGWAIAMRPLMLDLCVSARSAQWLFSARILECKFTPSHVSTTEQAKSRLEMMVSAYFCDRSRWQYFKCVPRFSTHSAAPGLVKQMLKFVLAGSAVSRDVDVLRALGDAV